MIRAESEQTPRTINYGRSSAQTAQVRHERSRQQEQARRVYASSWRRRGAGRPRRRAINGPARTRFPRRGHVMRGTLRGALRVVRGRCDANDTHAKKHAHVLRTARRAAADPARVGGMRQGAPQGVLARLGRAPLGFRGACALTRARRGHGKRELRAGLAPERAEVGPTVLPSDLQHSEPPRRGPCHVSRQRQRRPRPRPT